MKTQIEFIKTTCELCPSGCGVIVETRNGVPIGIKGDPDYPVNKGHLCSKGKASLEYLYNPNRLRYPLKRVGKKGAGKWEQVSWDEALELTAMELTNIKEKYSANAVVFIRGYTKGYKDNYSARFANLFGSPNIVSCANICYQPRTMATNTTFGCNLIPDYDATSCIVMWGVNSEATSIQEHVYEMEAIKRGVKLIVIDPADTEYAKSADIWIKPRPCTDLALALGMIHVIINEKLYDSKFVEEWTVGFSELSSHIQEYTPEKVESITWVPAEQIKEAARMYATTKPGCITWGNGLDNNFNNFQSSRAISILKAITGNIGVPGGEITWQPTGIMSRRNPDFMQQNAISSEVRATRLNGKDKFLPSVYYALPQTVISGITKDDPYPVRAAFVQGGNPLITWSDSRQTCEAFKQLDFLVVSDLFMTPTAELADIVLPVGMYLEIDGFFESLSMPHLGVTQKVVQVGESWSDYRIYRELAVKMGFGDRYPEEKEFIDWLLEPAGVTHEEFKRIRVISGKKQYRNYRKNNFNTPSGKIEILSSQLRERGFDALPGYREPAESPYSTPDLAKEYPFVLTNRKYSPYIHSGGKQIPSLRAEHPEPVVRIQKETARNLGIKDGDTVYIETKKGKIKQKAALSDDIDKRIILADFGWWFPEKGVGDNMHGWTDSNLNVLTDNNLPYKNETGTAILRGILCKVYKVDE